ncbi:MAG: magnesium-translocating P-type ATPase [Eubacteriaceae bacterium]|nr:magnesium-translocating P-type ATPase [Eubacteriaceae bacterium]
MAKKDVARQERINQRRQLERDIRTASVLNEDQLYTMHLTSQVGFTEEQVEELREDFGENIIQHEKEKPVWLKFILAFINPFSIVLFSIVGVSIITDVVYAKAGEKEWATVIIIMTIVVAAGLLEFWQEFKADREAKSLQNMVSAKASVIREGAEKDINVADVVPGDLIVLAAGDMIPADMRILQAKDLFISEAALTGESEPVEKYTQIRELSTAIEETSNVAFMGTNVVSGSAKGIVIATANDTYLGHIAHELSGTRAQTSFEKGIGSVSTLLLRITLIMVPVILLINGINDEDWMSALLFAMAVAVGVTPELLPMITTSTLAKGAMFMAKQKTIVKSLSSIQSFGAMDILCTDKTGTLTDDHIVLEKYLDPVGNEDMYVLRFAYLNSKYQTGLKNMIDLAIIDRAIKEGHEEWSEGYRVTDEIPWDFTRRRMSVVMTSEQGRRRLVTKGALEEMLKCCDKAYNGKSVVPLDGEMRKTVLEVSDTLNSEGMRVIAVATKNDVEDVEFFDVDNENAMTLIGFTAFLDPPKDSAKVAIEALNDHGVKVVVLTGDNEKVAATVCAKVGIDPDRIMMGVDVEPLSDDQLKDVIEDISIFAKLTPPQKARVVRCFQEMDHTVGFLGDGINDAPALRQADVGISVDSAVDISKESADIILLEKDLMVLEQGMLEGRRTFANLLKYLRLAVSGNFGNIFSILVASLFMPFLPMLPVMILVQNLLSDISQIAIPFDRVDSLELKNPKKWDIKGIARFAYVFGPLSSVFDIATFGVLWFLFSYNTNELQTNFQTGWFLFGITSQVIIFMVLRTKRIPFVQSMPSTQLIMSAAIVCAVAIALPYTVFGDTLGFVPMPSSYILWLFGVIFAYAVVAQAAKMLYIKKFGDWI